MSDYIEECEKATFKGTISIADVCLNPDINNNYKRALVITNEKGSTIVYEDLFHTDFEGGIDLGVKIKYLKQIKL